MKQTEDEDGTISYTQIKGRKTSIVIQQNERDRKRGNSEGTWYVFKVTAQKVETLLEGKKSECIRYANFVVERLESESKNGRK